MTDYDRSAERVLIALRRLHYQVTAARVIAAAKRLAEVLGKANFDPNQPRVPRGNSDGGRWALVSGVGSERSPSPLDPTDLWLSEPIPAARVLLVSDEGMPLGDPPEIPQERPSVAVTRNAIIKNVAKWLKSLSRAAGPATLFLDYVEQTWVRNDLNEIEAYLDEPQTLAELHRAVIEPKKGYHVHHVVEQTSAEQDGFPRSRIDAPENLVRIPTLIHREITAWYNRNNNKEFGDRSPREYLRGKSWEERQRIGLQALRDFGVLKP